MNYLEYTPEPARLLLTWQPPEAVTQRLRRIIAEIVRSPDGCSLRYLINSPDFQAAQNQGFQGYPAFDIKQEVHEQGIMEALSRRLPPRKREDFGDFLAQFRLPADFAGSDFALLGYTGGKLPSDTFGFAPDFSNISLPIDLLLEIAGFRHQDCMGQFTPTIGLPLQFVIDNDNQVDRNAVKVLCNGQNLGYINRAFLPWFADRVSNGEAIEATIERVNGKPERPLIYALCRLRSLNGM